MIHVHLTLHHRDGRVEESSLDGDGPFMPDGVLLLPSHADHWWKVRSLRWDAQRAVGFADLEPTDEPPPELARLAKSLDDPTRAFNRREICADGRTLSAVNER